MKTCRILIIDDEVDLCNLLQAYLSRKNYEVHIAHNLKDGLSKLRQIIPNIVFLDNNLPDGAGWEEVPKLSKTYPSLIINLISAFHPKIILAPGTENIRIIEKPLSLKEIDSYLAF